MPKPCRAALLCPSHACDVKYVRVDKSHGSREGPILILPGLALPPYTRKATDTPRDLAPQSERNP